MVCGFGGLCLVNRYVRELSWGTCFVVMRGFYLFVM